MGPTSEHYFFSKSVENSCFNAAYSFIYVYVYTFICKVQCMYCQLLPVSVNETTLEDAVTNKHCPDFEELRKECSFLNWSKSVTYKSKMS